MDDPAARAVSADVADAHANGATAKPVHDDPSWGLRQVGPQDVRRALERFSRVPPARVVKEGPLAFRYAVGRWSSLGEVEEGDLSLSMCQRELEGCFTVDDRPVGYALFDEYRPALFASDAAFWDDCDGTSQRSSMFAHAVLSAWPISHFEGGRLVEFTRLWMEPAHARSSEWAPVIWRLAVQSRGVV